MKNTEIYENIVTGDVIYIEVEKTSNKDTLLKNKIKEARKNPNHLKSPSFNNIKNWEKKTKKINISGE